MYKEVRGNEERRRGVIYYVGRRKRIYGGQGKWGEGNPAEVKDGRLETTQSSSLIFVHYFRTRCVSKIMLLITFDTQGRSQK